MAVNFIFPSHLLDESLDVRIKYFQEKTIKHQIQSACLDKALREIFNPKGAQIVFIFGPSGVGKTTIVPKIEQGIAERASERMLNDSSFIPYLSVEAKSPEDGLFDWGDFYTRALKAGEEPLHDQKVRPLGYMEGDKHVRRVRKRRKMAKSDGRSALEDWLQQRRPLALIIDEAQHLKKINGMKTLINQMDTLKSLANMSKTKIVLIGTYESLDLLKLSGQLTRRTREIHFPRYRWDIKEDRMEFARIVKSFQKNMPLVKEPNLVDYLDLLYKHSVGCIGILKDWLDRSLELCFEDDKQSITKAMLEKTKTDRKSLFRLAQELTEGEQYYETMEEEIDLGATLGMDVEIPKKEKKSGKSNKTHSLL